MVFVLIRGRQIALHLYVIVSVSEFFPQCHYYRKIHDGSFPHNLKSCWYAENAPCTSILYVLSSINLIDGTKKQREGRLFFFGPNENILNGHT